MDESGDGLISREEFDKAMKNPRVRYWFAALEIDLTHLPRLFQMLDIEGDNTISHEEFILGIKKLKGQAQSVDVLHILKEVQKLSKALVFEMAVTRERTREMMGREMTG